MKKKLSKTEIIELLAMVYWDREMNPEKTYELLYSTGKKNLRPEKIKLYARLLNSFDWYTILKMVPFEKVPEMLREDVLISLYPKELRDKFRYVRSVLSK